MDGQREERDLLAAGLLVVDRVASFSLMTTAFLTGVATWERAGGFFTIV